MSVSSPVKKTQQTSRVPLHANLRTQQRRLRHVRSLSIRNLVTPEFKPSLNVKLKFTLHHRDGSNIAFYTSSYLQETYNPSWGSLVFDHSVLGDNSVLNSFIVKIWQVIDIDTGGHKDLLCCEKIIDLQHFVFLGLTMIRHGKTSYSPNSVIVGLPEGYYAGLEDGGFPSPRRPSFHKIMNFLPPESLIEVRRIEVQDSYTLGDLKKLLYQQHLLKKLRGQITNNRTQLQTIRTKSEQHIKKRDEIIEIQTRCELLRKQIDEQRQHCIHEKEKTTFLQTVLDERETKFRNRKQDYMEITMKFDKHRHDYAQRRDILMKTQRKMYLRQRVMIAELAETFCIREMNNTFTICGVILPNGDPIEGGGAQPEQIGVALGFVTHLVYLLARFLLVPLQYSLRPHGSKSLVTDNLHEEQAIEFKDFPLYVKGVDKSLFQYGLYLLWRDILQLRQHCGYSNSRSSIKKTLPNLKSLLDRLVKDRYSVSPLSEMSPPSISITSATVSSPSPRTSAYYFATTPEASYLNRENSTTPTCSGSPGKDEEFSNSRQKEEYKHEGMSVDSNESSDLSKEHLRTRSSPVSLRRSHQIRRHPDGFMVKESLSPQTPTFLDHFHEEETLSQSPKDESIYSLNVVRPLSNIDQGILKLKSENSKMFSCSPTDVVVPLLSSPSSNSPKMSVMSNEFSGKHIESMDMCVTSISNSNIVNSNSSAINTKCLEQSNLEFCNIQSKGLIQIPDD